MICVVVFVHLCCINVILYLVIYWLVLFLILVPFLALNVLNMIWCCTVVILPVLLVTLNILCVVNFNYSYLAIFCDLCSCVYFSLIWFHWLACTREYAIMLQWSFPKIRLFNIYDFCDLTPHFRKLLRPDLFDMQLAFACIYYIDISLHIFHSHLHLTAIPHLIYTAINTYISITDFIRIWFLP